MEEILLSCPVKFLILACAGYAAKKFYDFVEIQIEVEYDKKGEEK